MHTGPFEEGLIANTPQFYDITYSSPQPKKFSHPRKITSNHDRHTQHHTQTISNRQILLVVVSHSSHTSQTWCREISVSFSHIYFRCYDNDDMANICYSKKTLRSNVSYSDDTTNYSNRLSRRWSPGD